MIENLIAVDVETTGIDANRNSLVSIGAVSISDPTNTFYRECVVWDGALITEEALRVNGFTHDQIVDAKKNNKTTEGGMIGEFFAWLPDSPMMIAHNSSFDRDFVAAAAKRAGLINPFSFRTVDIHSIVMLHLLRSKSKVPKTLSLNQCLKRLGFPPEPNPHNALTGAQCDAVLFDKVLNYDGEEQLGLL